jgi:hypothetical protein
MCVASLGQRWKPDHCCCCCCRRCRAATALRAAAVCHAPQRSLHALLDKAGTRRARSAPSSRRSGSRGAVTLSARDGSLSTRSMCQRVIQRASACECVRVRASTPKHSRSSRCAAVTKRSSEVDESTYPCSVTQEATWCDLPKRAKWSSGRKPAGSPDESASRLTVPLNLERRSSSRRRSRTDGMDSRIL